MRSQFKILALPTYLPTNLPTYLTLGTTGAGTPQSDNSLSYGVVPFRPLSPYTTTQDPPLREAFRCLCKSCQDCPNLTRLLFPFHSFKKPSSAANFGLPLFGFLATFLPAFATCSCLFPPFARWDCQVSLRCHVKTAQGKWRPHRSEYEIPRCCHW